MVSEYPRSRATRRRRTRNFWVFVAVIVATIAGLAVGAIILTHG
jgi:hypothetical protein